LSMTKIIFISDTHNFHLQLVIPPGDILIHGGDFTGRGTVGEVKAFAEWFSALPHRHKVVIAGNHDFACEIDPSHVRRLFRNVTYLQDELCTCDGITIYGSPWQPWFYDWAFNLGRGPDIAEKWELIPEGADILVTHGPPMGILDKVHGGEHAGCEDLLDRIMKVKPRFHVFGHIHEAYGVEQKFGTTFINGSICTRSYQPTNRPVEFTFPSR
jgi:Icc-related predicted phosphoesterase